MICMEQKHIGFVLISAWWYDASLSSDVFSLLGEFLLVSVMQENSDFPAFACNGNFSVAYCCNETC